MRVYRYGEISRTSAVSEGAVHVIQVHRGNRGEPVLSIQQCRNGVANDQKGRMPKEMQVVGWPNSTDETSEMMWRK